MHTYATTQELKKKHFKQKKKNNIKEANGLQVNFVFEIKLKRYICFAKYDSYFGDWCVHFDPMLRWECAYVCLNVRTEKGNTYGEKSWEKKAIGIQVTFISQKKLQKQHFLAKNTVFLATYASILNPCYDQNVPTYTTTKKLKNIPFKIISQTIKQKFGIQLIFISEIKPRLNRFLVKCDCFFGDLWVHLEPLLRWECAYVCHD